MSPQAKRGGLIPLLSLRGSVMPKQSHCYKVEIATLLTVARKDEERHVAVAIFYLKGTKTPFKLSPKRQ